MKCFGERIGKKVTTEIKKTTLKVLRLKERHRMSTFCIQISQIRDVYSATAEWVDHWGGTDWFTGGATGRIVGNMTGFARQGRVHN